MTKIHKTDEAIGFLPLPGDQGKPFTVIGTDPIRDAFDDTCVQQAINSRMAPGVTDVILNPDAHAGYGAPVGCVMVSPTHIYPGPVGVDIKCSMSLLQLDIPEDAIRDKETRRALINAIIERTLHVFLVTAIARQAGWLEGALAFERDAVASEGAVLAPLARARDRLRNELDKLDNGLAALEREHPGLAAAAASAATSGA